MAFFERDVPLFRRNKSVISKHIKIYSKKESWNQIKLLQKTQRFKQKGTKWLKEPLSFITWM